MNELIEDMSDEVSNTKQMTKRAIKEAKHALTVKKESYYTSTKVSINVEGIEIKPS